MRTVYKLSTPLLGGRQKKVKRRGAAAAEQSRRKEKNRIRRIAFGDRIESFNAEAQRELKLIIWI
jgi:hypothetical protein